MVGELVRPVKTRRKVGLRRCSYQEALRQRLEAVVRRTAATPRASQPHYRLNKVNASVVR